MPPSAYTRYCTIIPPFFFFVFSFYSFFFFLLLVCLCVHSIVIENLFKRVYTYIYIYCEHTYQYCHIYLCVHNFLPPFFLLSIYLALFMALNTISFLLLYCPQFMTGKTTKYFIRFFFRMFNRRIIILIQFLFFSNKRRFVLLIWS
jgi:hypothetical protein